METVTALTFSTFCTILHQSFDAIQSAFDKNAIHNSALQKSKNHTENPNSNAAA
jgi:hypothetical protein